MPLPCPRASLRLRGPRRGGARRRPPSRARTQTTQVGSRRRLGLGSWSKQADHRSCRMPVTQHGGERGIGRARGRKRGRPLLRFFLHPLVAALRLSSPCAWSFASGHGRSTGGPGTAPVAHHGEERDHQPTNQTHFAAAADARARAHTQLREHAHRQASRRQTDTMRFSVLRH
jgi:hypothetical protein